jgi:hypothetical protein
VNKGRAFFLMDLSNRRAWLANLRLYRDFGDGGPLTAETGLCIRAKRVGRREGGGRREGERGRINLTEVGTALSRKR